jgi:hypothetical protein
MPSIRNLIARSNVVSIDDAGESDYERNEDTIKMMAAVLSLVIFGLFLATILLYFRRLRQQKQMMQFGAPPAYHDVHQGGLTIQTTDKHGRSSVFVINKDGQPMLSNPQQPPHSPDNVPQIRITFPDEQDEAGRTKGGRVVVVRMGETTVGLEPVREEQLPVYEKENSSQFYSIDMDKIGGLKEKDRSQFH